MVNMNHEAVEFEIDRLQKLCKAYREEVETLKGGLRWTKEKPTQTGQYWMRVGTEPAEFVRLWKLLDREGAHWAVMSLGGSRRSGAGWQPRKRSRRC